MNLEDARGAYYRFSGKASDIARQLNFVGLALVWLFAIQGEEGSKLPSRLVLVTGLIVVSLALDLLQHLYGSAAWGIYPRLKELSGVSEGQDFAAPAKINWPTNILFWSKHLPVLATYALLLRHLHG